MSTSPKVGVEYQELKDYDPEQILTRQDTRDRSIQRQEGYRYDDMMAKYRMFTFLKFEWFIFHLIFIIVLFEENHFYESYKDSYHDEYELCDKSIKGTRLQLFLLVCETTLTFVMLIIFFVNFRRGQYIFYQSNDIGSVSLSKQQWNERKLSTKKIFYKLCAYDFGFCLINNIILLIIISIGVNIQIKINNFDSNCCFNCSKKNDYSGVIYIFFTYIILQIMFLILLNRKLKQRTTINWINDKFTCF